MCGKIKNDFSLTTEERREPTMTRAELNEIVNRVINDNSAEVNQRLNEELSMIHDLEDDSTTMIMEMFTLLYRHATLDSMSLMLKVFVKLGIIECEDE